MTTPVRTLAAVSLLGTLAFAQAPGAHWSTTPTPSDPPLRRENPGTADSSFMYVFGGRSGGSGGVSMNDLWRFDGAAWTQMTADGAPGSPPARDQAGVTWDFGRGRLVVFGGGDDTGAVFGDTWEWDPGTNTWANVTPAISPTARRFCAITFDPSNGKILLFGGLDASGTHLNDTWTFDGTTWTQLSPSGSLPPVRRQHHLVTRLDFGDVILCGGQDATLSGSAKWRIDTWRWDGAHWIQIPTSAHPNGQVANDAAYDLIRQRIVLTGGNGTGGSPTGTTAEFDARTNDWIIRPLDPGIYKTSRYFAAFIPSVGKTFKVSGQALNSTTPPDKTYEFQSDHIAEFTPAGSGCQTSAGVPDLSATTRPWIGETLAMQVANTPMTASTLILTGLGTTSIPLDALGLGGPGCTVTVDPIVAIPALPSGSTGVPTLSLIIPADISLAGGVVYFQAAVIEGGLISVSNRGDATLAAL